MSAKILCVCQNKQHKTPEGWAWKDTIDCVAALLGKPNRVIFVLLVHNIKIPLYASHSIAVTSEYDLVQQLFMEGGK